MQQNFGRGCLVLQLQVVVKTGNFKISSEPSSNHLCPDTAAPYHQSLVDQFLDSAPDRRPRDAKLFGDLQLIFDAATGGQVTTLDRFTHALGDLIVHRYRSRPIEVEEEV